MANQPFVKTVMGSRLRGIRESDKGIHGIAQPPQHRCRAAAHETDIEPEARGHCVFFPRRHVPNLHDLDDAETAEVLSLLKRVAVALELKEYNVLQNNGARAGQTVFHAHVHLVPKPTAAAGLIVQVGLTRVDQTGLAKEIRHRLGAPRAAGESQAGG